ncbi:hypothetical protein BCR32DRAFT_324026 [Anaeromyces robustus]|uniref:Uncharacterized protein n=1 Tax=Anaeromyces robustus TaxID=1754192 RepID=A0A1Y1XR39_9FUNG|nr:hypothetical protein BCR32DRAFT_324026 [Anaeromyces robustus]|eukprot:ORX88203.1 hypothetical protein BCR32DRAFT_324026 [Anaeromyces robustus]
MKIYNPISVLAILGLAITVTSIPVPDVPNISSSIILNDNAGNIVRTWKKAYINDNVGNVIRT